MPETFFELSILPSALCDLSAYGCQTVLAYVAGCGMGGGGGGGGGDKQGLIYTIIIGMKSIMPIKASRSSKYLQF